jgi:hypothetical protein
VKADFYYYGCLLFRYLFGVNIYDAILIIARKDANPAPSQQLA